MERWISENSDLMKQWDYEKNLPLTPETVRAFSNKKVWWKCAEGHSWQSGINNRSNGNGCPYCSGRRAITGINDLATVNPVVAKEWDFEKNQGSTPDTVTEGSSKKVWWRCEKGHSWNAVIYSRRQKGCPYCAGKKVLVGFNDLATLEPDIASEWDYEANKDLRPEQVTRKSGKKVWWRCKKGHSWKTAVMNRAYGTGCPYCSRKRLSVGENDVRTLRPELVIQWDFEKNDALTPDNVSIYANKKIWWKCEKGHSWRTKIANRTIGKGCPYCGRRKVSKGENDLATVIPELLYEWDFEKNQGCEPADFRLNSTRKVWWKCKKGHSWKAKIYSRSSGSGCPYCAGRVRMRTSFIS